jgi:hypothetical protein
MSTKTFEEIFSLKHRKDKKPLKFPYILCRYSGLLFDKYRSFKIEGKISVNTEYRVFLRSSSSYASRLVKYVGTRLGSRGQQVATFIPLEGASKVPKAQIELLTDTYREEWYLVPKDLKIAVYSRDLETD